MSRATSTTVGVLVGGAVGAIAALLLAPKRERRCAPTSCNGHAIRSIRPRIGSGRRAPALHQPPADAVELSQKAPELIERAKSRFQRGAELTAHMMESTTEKAAESMEKGSEQEHSSQQIPIA